LEINDWIIVNTKKKLKKGLIIMGAIERNGFRFIPEYSVSHQNGAIHVYNKDRLIEEIKFQFSGDFPELDQIEDLVDQYCNTRQI
jgi:hypothetical protein